MILFLWLVSGFGAGILGIYIKKWIEKDDDIVVTPKIILLILSSTISGFFSVVFIIVLSVIVIIEDEQFIKWLNKPIKKSGETNEL